MAGLIKAASTTRGNPAVRDSNMFLYVSNGVFDGGVLKDPVLQLLLQENQLEILLERNFLNILMVTNSLKKWLKIHELLRSTGADTRRSFMSNSLGQEKSTNSGRNPYDTIPNSDYIRMIAHDLVKKDEMVLKVSTKMSIVKPSMIDICIVIIINSL